MQPSIVADIPAGSHEISVAVVSRMLTNSRGIPLALVRGPR